MQGPGVFTSFAGSLGQSEVKGGCDAVQHLTLHCKFCSNRSGFSRKKLSKDDRFPCDYYRFSCGSCKVIFFSADPYLEQDVKLQCKKCNIYFVGDSLFRTKSTASKAPERHETCTFCNSELDTDCDRITRSDVTVACVCNKQHVVIPPFLNAGWKIDFQCSDPCYRMLSVDYTGLASVVFDREYVKCKNCRRLCDGSSTHCLGCLASLDGMKVPESPVKAPQGPETIPIAPHEVLVPTPLPTPTAPTVEPGSAKVEEMLEEIKAGLPTNWNAKLISVALIAFSVGSMFTFVVTFVAMLFLFRR